MLMLITYDVNIASETGKKRLRNVAKVCVDYGQRVQNSVFECNITPEQLILIKEKLKKIIDMDNDSIRFYNLGKNYKNKIETLGKNNTYDAQEDVFIL